MATLSAALLGLLMLSFAGPAAAPAAPAEASPATKPAAKATTPFYTTAEGVALGGYDAVSYFDGSPALGKEEFSAEYLGAKFRFSSAEHKATFVADPVKYAPQYGGYCAYGLAKGGYRAKTEPLAYTVHNGKLYINYNDSVTKTWRKDIEAYIAKADATWVKLSEEAKK